jgi:hypothetical protein
MASTKPSKPQIRTFLSHKYRSTAANLYFWSVLSEEAGFQFEVDEGTKPTNVTRLELMMRACDAVVGIFTLPDSHATLTKDELLKESAYFRLETDIALRSGRPVLLFVDRRYASVFPMSSAFYVQYFNAREIESGTVSPSHQRFVDTCKSFCREVSAHQARELSRRAEIDPNKVYIAVAANASHSAYSREAIERIGQALEAHGVDHPEVMRFPDASACFQLSSLDTANWVVADVGPELFRTGLVGYMHGRFIPMMRLFHEETGGSNVIGEHRCLHANIEKGYDSDLVRWNHPDDLAAKVGERLKVIRSEPYLVATEDDATLYFAKASLRKESVFLSYSGNDFDIATRISKALKAKFQDVFDYRDGKSIRTGRPWIDEIDLNLRRAAVGVQLLSPTYLASGNCVQEAQIMNEFSNQQKLKLCSVKLRDEEFDAPMWMTVRQYVRLYQLPTVEAVVDEVVGLLQAA